MITKTLSQGALSVIDQYLHFKVGSATASVPYFYNKTTRNRAALRTNIGKGSPREIFEEIQPILFKSHIDEGMLTDDMLKKILVDANLGIDCSALAYYVLNAEIEKDGADRLEKHISFVNCTGFLGKMRCSLRPIENCDVSTLAHNKNSKAIDLISARPGDIITMLGNRDDDERDHILIIREVAYADETFVPTSILYTHAMAYPEDGIYGSGIRQGKIEIADISKPLTDALWSESGAIEKASRIFARAQRSKTEVRRLNYYSETPSRPRPAAID